MVPHTGRDLVEKERLHQETAVANRRKGAELVKREPQPRREHYERAVERVLATLQAVQNVPLLLRSYFTVSEDRWRVLAEACDTDVGWPLVRGIVEDAAFERGFREIVAESQRGGPLSRR